MSQVQVRSIAAGSGLACLTLYSLYVTRKRLFRSSLKSSPPVLAKKPHYVAFGNVPGPTRGDVPMDPILYLKDDYFYVRDDKRENKEIISHLEKENEYTQAQLQHLSTLRDTIYQELLSHVQETDETYPYKYGSFRYYTKTITGQSYKYHCRKPDQANATEQIILDENKLAEGQKHCDVRSVAPSPDHTILAYGVDFSGYETYTIYFRTLATEQLLEDQITGTSGGIAWGKDNSCVYYATQDDAHRTYKIWKHVMGTPQSEDECLYKEDDEVFSAWFGKTLSGRFILIGSGSSETDEVSYIDLHDPNAKVTLIQSRVKGVQYQVDHHGDQFYIVTNRDKAINFKLMSTAITKPSGEHWKEVIPYDSRRKTDGISCFKNHFVISGRENGFTQLWVMSATNQSDIHQIKFEEPIYTVFESVNKEFDTDVFRLGYTSMTTPTTYYDYDVSSRQKHFLREKPCPNYDRTLYTTERMEAISTDGTIIPMSVIYRKDKVRKGVASPVHLYGYGSYEISIDPEFNSTILPLLDRGVTYIIAHIRGGGEMGRSWYEDAKYLNKRRTFDDFITCAEHLVDTGITTTEQLTIEGRSAGGLLMGAVLNMRPDLFKAAVAGVPFVDVMNSMCDSTIPLTTGEWEEWGNPNEAKYFQYMLSYSPYENVRAQAYPNILITSGFYDPRVAYWEPTKWAAKLRDLKTDENQVLLKMDLSSGHFSASDRYHYLKEKAFDISYLLDQLNLTQS